jgi:hypothetical protein
MFDANLSEVPFEVNLARAGVDSRAAPALPPAASGGAAVPQDPPDGLSADCLHLWMALCRLG